MSKRRQMASARQLSLVAFLLSSAGRARDEADIREHLLFYADVYDASLKGDESNRKLADDSLRKQLARDVEALADIGIAVEVDGKNAGRRYRISAEGFSPVEVELDGDERAVLVGALRALRRDFPYLGPLKLAIANMIGAASDAESPQDAAAFALIATRDDERVSSRLAVLERAISRRKRVEFDYYAITSDETSRRSLEPYALSILDGIWYVTGWDTDREAIRQFRLSRVQGRIINATRKDTDGFDISPNFRQNFMGQRAAWQLENSDTPAYIRVSDEAFRAARMKFGVNISMSSWNDGERVLYTGYSGERQLAGWVLSLGEEARVLDPARLVNRVEVGLEKILASHGGDV